MRIHIVPHTLLCRGLTVPPHGCFIGAQEQRLVIRTAASPFSDFFRTCFFSQQEAFDFLRVTRASTDHLVRAITTSSLPPKAEQPLQKLRERFYSLLLGDGDETCCDCVRTHGHVYLMGRIFSPAFVSIRQGVGYLHRLRRAPHSQVSSDRLLELETELNSWGLLPRCHLRSI